MAKWLHRLGQQVGQQRSGLSRERSRVCGQGLSSPRQMHEQRAILQGQQTLHHILHHQLTPVVKAHRRAQVEVRQ